MHYNLQYFRSTCSYCHLTLEDTLFICQCGISLCHKHTLIHFFNKHTLLFYIDKSDKLIVFSKILSKNQTDFLERFVYAFINQNRKICAHLQVNNCKMDCNSSDKSIMAFDDFRIKNQCEDCECKSGLWMCVHCGYTGCGRNELGNHAQVHCKNESHFVVVNNQSQGWCYACDDFVFPGSFNNPKSSAPILDSESNSIEFSNSDSQYFGLPNLGNTCFIGSVVHLIACIPFDDTHFSICSNNPLECLTCQTIRVIYAINNHKKVPIEDFIDLIYKEFSFFQKGSQQDASEFLIFYLEYLSKHLKNVFEGEYVTIHECECILNLESKDCSCSKTVIKEKSPFLNIEFGEDIFSGLSKSFCTEKSLCVCNKPKKTSHYIRLLPDYLILIVKRWLPNLLKNTDKIFCNPILNVEEHLFPIEVQEKQILCFTPSESKDALIIADNDEEKATELLLTNNVKLRNNPEFKLKGAVCHDGKSMDSGHYVFIRKEDEIWLMDDEKVKVGNEDMLEGAYIVLYK